VEHLGKRLAETENNEKNLYKTSAKHRFPPPSGSIAGELRSRHFRRRHVRQKQHAGTHSNGRFGQKGIKIVPFYEIMRAPTQ
jgi:hypothetical protein